MYKSWLIILIPVLLAIPIVKAADSCGFSCPSVSDNASFWTRLVCSIGKWFFCYPLTLVIFIIIFVIGWFVWSTRPEETRSKVKMVSTVLFVIILLIIFYPSIKALLFTNPFESQLNITEYYTSVGLLGDQMGIPYYFIRDGRSGNFIVEAQNTGSSTYAQVSCEFKDPDNNIYTNSSSCESISVKKNYTVSQFMNKPFPYYVGWYLNKCEVKSATKSDCSDYARKEFNFVDVFLWNVEPCNQTTASLWCFLNVNSVNATWSNYGFDSYGNDSYWLVYCSIYTTSDPIIKIKPLSGTVNMSVDFSFSSLPMTNDCTISVTYPEEGNCTQACSEYAFTNITAEYGTLYDITIINGLSDYYP